MKKIKILHLLSSNRFSGAENVVFQIINMMKNESEFELIYCSCDGQIREALKEQGIEFVPLNDITINEVKRVIREQRPDIIHAHDMRASLIAAITCRKTPLISHIHNNNYDSRGLSLKSIGYYFAAKKAKHIFWVSQSSFDGYFFNKYFINKSTVLYNIIDTVALETKMGTDDNTYNYDVVYVGRLTSPKNPQRLIQVFSKIVEQLPSVKIAVIGTGDLEKRTKDLSSELLLDENVSFLGFQNNPLKILHDSKLMMMTSRWEGTPMCALEAMALGVPIVSTPTDGLKELIENDRTGYLSDEDNMLAKRAIDIIIDSELHKKLSECAKSTSQRINAVEPYRNTILKIYKN